MEPYIIGIIGGCGFLSVVLIIIIVAVVCCRKLKKSKEKSFVIKSVRGDTNPSVTQTIRDIQKKHGVVSNRTISGIAKLPPKGEEEEAPLPPGYEEEEEEYGGPAPVVIKRADPGMTAPIKNAKEKKGGKIYDPGMTAPIRKASDPGMTAPIKMANKGRNVRDRGRGDPGMTAPIRKIY